MYANAIWRAAGDKCSVYARYVRHLRVDIPGAGFLPFSELLECPEPSQILLLPRKQRDASGGMLQTTVIL